MPVSTDLVNSQNADAQLVQQAFECSPNSIYIIDPTAMRFVNANQTALRSLGYTKEELLSKTPQDIDASFSNEVMAAGFDGIIKSKEQHAAFPAVHRRKDGSTFEVETYLRCFTDNNKTYILASAANTSVLKTAQEQLQFHATLFSSISDAVVATDARFCITSYNQHAREMFGWMEEEAIGKHAREWTNTIFSDTLPEQVQQQLFAKGSWKGEITTHKKNGDAFPAIISIGVLKNEDGKMTGTVSVIRDITETKQLEKQLKDFNEQSAQHIIHKTEELTNVFDRISDGFTALDADWNYTYINKKAAEITGRDPNGMIGKNIWQEFPELAGTSLYHKYQKTMQDQQVFRTEEYVDIFQKWFEGVLYPSPQGLSVYFHDITDKKNAEQALAESELQYRTIVETVHEGIWQIDENGNTAFVNNFMTALLGYTKEELINASMFQFMSEEAKQQAQELVEKRKKGIARQHEFTFIKKDGSPVYTLLQTVPLFKEGRYKGALVIVLDISERKMAEERNRFKANLLNTIGQAVIATDLQGIVTYWNKAAESIYGWSEAEAMDKNIIELTPAYQSRDLAMQIIEVLKQGNTWSGELEVRRKDETVFPVFVTHTPIYNEQGKLSGIIGVSSDITEYKRIEDRLRESKARYRRAQSHGKLGHWERDLITNQFFWSDEIYKIYGLNPETTKPDYHTFINAVHPDDRERLLREIALAISHSKYFDVFYRVVLKSGAIRYMHEVGEAIRNKSGQLVKLAGMVQDVTEQKRVEEALLLSQKNYRLLFEQNPVPLWMTDADTFAFIDINHAAVAQYGYSKDAFISLNAKDLKVPEEHPFLQILKQRGKDIKRLEDVVQHRKKNGDIIYVKINANLITYNGRAVWLAAGWDITQELLYRQSLQQKQQQLSLIFNSTENAMWLLKVEANNIFRILLVNEAFVNLSGVNKEDLPGHTVDEIFGANEYQNVYARYKACVESGAVQKFTNTLWMNNEEVIFDFTISPIKDEGGNVTQLLGVSADITSQKRRERQLVESKEKYRALFEKSPLPHWIFEEKTLRFLEVNLAAVKQYGYSREEFLSMSLLEIRPKKNALELAAMNKTDWPETVEFYSLHKKKSGELMKVQVTANSIWYENKLARMAIVLDRTEQEKAKDALIATTQQLRELTSYLQDIREEERTNIAREIHDELGQQLTALKMDISWIGRKLTVGDENIRNKIRTAIELADSTISAVRRIAAQLRPSMLDDLGLAEAIAWQSHEFSSRTGIVVSCSTDVPDDKFPPAISIAIFRIFQEALTNIARHANATEVLCNLQKKNNLLCLTVKDNGVGFDINGQAKRKTLGLLGMKERAIMLNGKYSIESHTGKGTTVSVEIPLR